MQFKTAYWGLVLFLVGAITALHAKHVYISRPEGIEDGLKASGRQTDKHLDKRMSQWYHGFQERHCGHQTIQPINPKFKIIGGKQAIPGSWPWMVSIFSTVPFPSHICGGTLISDQWVLTAAHCRIWVFFGHAQYSNFTVRAGKSLLYETEESEQSSGVEEFIAHPQFIKMKTKDYDIALIKLKTKVRWNDRVSPICLPEISADSLSPYTQYIATGWGVTVPNSDNATCSPVLRQVVLPLIDKAACEKFPLDKGRITEREFCAGYTMGGRDTCAGDSGSPLQYQDGDTWYIKGITSRGGVKGNDCARPYRPGIYTDVLELLHWVLWEMFLYS